VVLSNLFLLNFLLIPLLDECSGEGCGLTALFDHIISKHFVIHITPKNFFFLPFDPKSRGVWTDADILASVSTDVRKRPWLTAVTYFGEEAIDCMAEIWVGLNVTK